MTIQPKPRPTTDNADSFYPAASRAADRTRVNRYLGDRVSPEKAEIANKVGQPIVQRAPMKPTNQSTTSPVTNHTVTPKPSDPKQSGTIRRLSQENIAQWNNPNLEEINGLDDMVESLKMYHGLKQEAAQNVVAAKAASQKKVESQPKPSEDEVKTREAFEKELSGLLGKKYDNPSEAALIDKDNDRLNEINNAFEKMIVQKSDKGLLKFVESSQQNINNKVHENNQRKIDLQRQNTSASVDGTLSKNAETFMGGLDDIQM